MKLSKIKLYFNTIRYLKWIQVRYQVWYRVRSEWRNIFKYQYQLSSPSHSVSLKFIDWIDKPESLSGDSFRFLNISTKFENLEINWNFDGCGKLWNYNLNYMDFLLQPDMGKGRGIKLINDFVQKLANKSTGLEPYPISLRGINWIKFLTKHGIQNQRIDNSLYAQYKILLDKLEYHLLGNHLLENGFSLLFGAFYYYDLRLFHKAKDIIETELIEQILDDGGHFELSPMYHQIILDRLLDCINLLQNNESFKGQEKLLTLMQNKGVLMVRWLNSMTFSNGNIPMFNDSASKIAPSTKDLNNYAIRLGIISEVHIREAYLHPNMKDSGYRRFNSSNYECIIDVGQIGPDYQPGHAHADTFSFELHLHGKPLIVDTGISTYEKNERRQCERNTVAHNTVEINGRDSSEVWGGFRVARRAFVNNLLENNAGIRARHSGYNHLRYTHERSFLFEENRLEIFDHIIGKNPKNSVARFHFHADKHPVIKGKIIYFNGGTLTFVEGVYISINEFQYASEFNNLISAKVVEVIFSDKLTSSMKFT